MNANSLFMKRFLVILMAFLSIGFMGASTAEDLENKVWQSLEKAEIKLNENLPRTLVENLIIDKIEVSRANKLVIYTGVVKNYDRGQSEILTDDQKNQKAKQNTVNFICSKSETIRFLQILSMIDANVKYQFFQEHRQTQQQPFIEFIVSYNDCLVNQKNQTVI